LAIAGLVGLSGWTALAPSGLRTDPFVAPAETIETTDAGPDRKAAEPGDGVRRANGLSGARVEETVTDDGSVVRKYAPGTRDGTGPVILEANRVGQDARTAAFPNEDLLEDTSDGKIPVIGLDGTRPMDQYARPWSGARGTRIAIVVGGLGLSQTGTQRAIRELPGEVTLAFAASGNSLQRWMQEARRAGHEILLQLPLEPFDYPQNDPGPYTLRTDMSEAQNLAELHRAMARITNYTGIVNFMGGRFLSSADALEPVMRDVASRGLLFLDDASSAQSLSGTIAGAVSAPHAFADLQLDADLSRTAVLKKLDELERIARRNGTAIGIASAFDESVDAIREWCEEAGTRGIEIVGVASLADIPAKR
jgi:polysaccharide deacetylase 2 family uncharacterized protein YibQ